MHSIYRLPPTDMISGPQTSHELNVALLYSEDALKLYTHWNETETTQFQTVVKLFRISFISLCGQIKQLVLYFSLVGFICIYFNLTRIVVSYVTAFQISWREH